MKNKQLVVCSACQEKGIISVLGEIDEKGYFVVMRFHKGYTKVKAEHFIVVCGACETPNYKRGTYSE